MHLLQQVHKVQSFVAEPHHFDKAPAAISKNLAAPASAPASAPIPISFAFYSENFKN
jgi:hypothetical protein